MIESFLTVVDNLLAVDPLELQESQQLFNTSARLIIEAEAYTTVLYSSSEVYCSATFCACLCAASFEMDFFYAVLSMHYFRYILFFFTCAMYRLLEAIQTVTDALPIPENESHAVIALSSFVVAVQEIQADSVQQQSFR